MTIVNCLVYLSGLVRRHPVFPSFATPSYSNAAFAILGFVIEAVTGKAYDAALEESVLKLLGLTSTSVQAPSGPSGNNVILDPDFWRWDLGAENPSVLILLPFLLKPSPFSPALIVS